MTGWVLGVALLVNSPGVSPEAQPPRAVFAPAAVTFDVPTPERSRWLDRGAVRHGQSPTKQHNLTDRIIAIAAGASLGFLVGGVVGGKITDRSKTNPDDDVSVLKGIMIGAPIGAAVGAIIGWRLTRN